MKSVECIPRGVKEMTFLLEDQGFPVKKVTEIASNVYFILSEGTHKSRSFKLEIEFHEAFGILYFATQCRKPVPSKKVRSN